MRDELEAFDEAGAEVVLVGNGSAAFAEGFRDDVGWNGRLLIDTELRAYRAAGLRRGRAEVLSPRLVGNAARALSEGYRQAAVQGDPWQLGGVFVIRPGGTVTFRQASREAGDHADLEAVKAALEPDAPPADLPSGPTPLRRFVGRTLSRFVDPGVAFSFDRTGFEIHAMTWDPADLEADLTGKRCVITGANSGIGFEAALGLADLGGEVVLVCRDEERGMAAREEVRARTGNSRIELHLGDLSDLESVSRLAKDLGKDPIDVLIHNAGLLPSTRSESPQGHEITWATHVLGPHLLTHLLKDRLVEAGGRIVWVSSGGMYTKRLQLGDPQWTQREYDGVAAYAETKRAQVILAEEWARALPRTVAVSAMHPGWADTPGVEESLPRFHRLMRDRLRTPAQGADTVVWLAAAEAARETSGGFFFDRVRRSPYWLPGTRETAAQRRRFWQDCEDAVAIYRADRAG